MWAVLEIAWHAKFVPSSIQALLTRIVASYYPRDKRVAFPGTFILTYVAKRRTIAGLRLRQNTNKFRTPGRQELS